MSDENMERKYGYFKCEKDKKTWESAQTYCDKKTGAPLYEQDCKVCETPAKPYKTEPIMCSRCFNEQCTCSHAEKQEKRHVNPNKPHRADLCHKCKAGNPCQ